MDIIFDLKPDSDWASAFNEEVNKGFPEYFKEHPLIGSDEWWATTEQDISKGRITDVGVSVEDGELMELVTIQPLDNDLNGEDSFLTQPEYCVHREDFWLHEAVQKDKLVQIKSVTICPTGELDENSIYLETEVAVW